MQFFLNGFRTGDPDRHEALPQTRRGDRIPEELDVLIVGCGPAGLMLAAQLAAFPDIRFAIADLKHGPLLVGQADGIACRTMEMAQAFGFSEKLAREAYWVNETTFWKPDSRNSAQIARSSKIQDVEDGLSEFPHVIINQARVHDHLLTFMRNAPARNEPYYLRRFVELKIDARAGDHPVTAVLERLDPARQTGKEAGSATRLSSWAAADDGGPRGETETVRARYVVGCDGARSSVRRAIGHTLRGDSASQAWGVMDVLAITNFPDVRKKSVIQSTQEGNMLIIPREGGYMFRMYIELDKLNVDERVTDRNITIDTLVSAARRILAPYSLDVKEVAWWSFYEIGQRICDKYDDVPAGREGEQFPRVFIAGDACHTHSPKAGQGLNISIRDSFNLGWKLGAVLRGQAHPRLLHTYSTERRAEAQELIDFDREFAKMFSTPPKSDKDPDGVEPAEFQRYFMQFGRFTAGVATHYGESIIRAAGTHQRLATGFVLGMRFHSAPVLRLGDAKPEQLAHCATADGRWRLFVFAAREDPRAPGSGVARLAEYLAHAETSPVRRYTPVGADIDAVIDVRFVLQNHHDDIEIDDLHPFMLPAKGKYGLRDYEKVFCPDFKSGSDIFDLRGIDRDSGCVVVVRPDQHVADILPLDGTAALERFFAGFMLDPGTAKRDD
jgi:phenol 2-monooxygenase